MALTTRRLKITLGLLVAAAVLAAAYMLRQGGRPTGSDHATASGSAASAPPPSQRTSGAPAQVARGDVTIDAQRQQLIGVRLAPVTRESLAATVRTTGIVKYDETRLADVNVKLDGWIRDLRVDYTGQFVQRGQPLFTLYSPDLLATQKEYVLALESRDHLNGSVIPDAREYADRLVEAARQRLVLWDLPPEEITALEQRRQPRDAIVFRSPVTGFVIDKQILQGMHVMPGQTLYKVADLSVVWVEADVYEQEVATMRVGQRATVTLDAYPGKTFSGRATYIHPFVEENTRTVKVRLQFANPGHRLKPGMYANVELQGVGGMGLTVPADAVLDSGTEHVVFVSQGEGYFIPRQVKIGRRLTDRIEIIAGVKEGEQVATGATFFLDSESQLRAGLQNYGPPPSAQDAAPATPAPLAITFRQQPDPPKTGENTLEVAVKDATGNPVTDADVSVQLFMPAMPTMNMPAMRNETKLPHVGGGVYRGRGQVMMAGRWNVTVTVSRGGQPLGRKQLAVVAR